MNRYLQGYSWIRPDGTRERGHLVVRAATTLGHEERTVKINKKLIKEMLKKVRTYENEREKVDKMKSMPTRQYWSTLVQGLQEVRKDPHDPSKPLRLRTRMVTQVQYQMIYEKPMPNGKWKTVGKSDFCDDETRALEQAARDVVASNKFAIGYANTPHHIRFAKKTWGSDDD